MLASRHHSRCRKLPPLIRATSALNDSSNQKGLRVRYRNRTTVPAAITKRRLSHGVARAESCGDGEAPALWLAAASDGCMLKSRFQNDTMLENRQICPYFRPRVVVQFSFTIGVILTGAISGGGKDLTRKTSDVLEHASLATASWPTRAATDRPMDRPMDRQMKDRWKGSVSVI